MTATDELRRLLDERGVEWWQSANTLGCIFTRWYSPIFGDEVVAMENGEEGLVLFDHYLTPEQAIAATLGDAPRLPYFWTHDGTLHVELPKLPESISVRLPDKRDRDVRSARVWQYTLGDTDATSERHGVAGTCKDVAIEGEWFECSECGTVKQLIHPNYCPNCGRRVVE